MLDQRYDADIKDELGRTPLHVAASQGKEKIVQLLLGKVKDKNAKDKNKQTALHLAAGLGKKKAVDELL